MKGFVAVTDADWIAHLRSTKATEANFWQPRPTRIAMPEWTPWIFKVRRTNLVAGYAFEELRMTDAPSTSSGKAFCTVKSTPLTLVPNVDAYCSSVICPSGANVPPQH
jgi:hypothetical protein